MKTTALHKFHIDRGAKMVPFAGYEMPVQYPLGVLKEHLHTRAAAGLFDISHMMHVVIEGASAAKFIAHLAPLRPSDLSQGEAKYSVFLNGQAGIIDDIIVTRLGDERFLIVCNAGCAEKDFEHITSEASAYDVSRERIERSFLALQGPKAEAVLTSAGMEVAHLNFMEARELGNGWFVSRTGYTGEDGFEVALPNDAVVEFTQKLVSNDAVEPIGLGARDSLRIEAGLSLYGQDLAEDITPHEAGLMWAIPKDLRAEGTFIGADALRQSLADGRKRMRVGLSTSEKVPVRAGTDLVNEAGDAIGSVTSGGFGPSADAPVALGLISTEAADEPIFAQVRKRTVPMIRAKLPFTPHNYKRKPTN
ncbi:MAG: glycine cleavage system aminomethyltransferase GcvT [Pseudomonadota bacterium]